MYKHHRGGDVVIYHAPCNSTISVRFLFCIFYLLLNSRVGKYFEVGFSGIGVAYGSAVKSERGSELEMPEIVAWLSYWCVFTLVSGDH